MQKAEDDLMVLTRFGIWVNILNQDFVYLMTKKTSKRDVCKIYTAPVWPSSSRLNENIKKRKTKNIPLKKKKKKRKKL